MLEVNSAAQQVIDGLDEQLNYFVRRVRFFNEPMTKERARMFILQHRLNSRQRNSVHKPRVAVNCPDWEIRISILEACAEEVIGDDEFGGGRPHWKILEELGTKIGLSKNEIEQATPSESTQLAWCAWETLTGNRHWLEGLIANTCVERINVPGYGDGIIKESGWFGLEFHRWKKIFDLTDADLEFFSLHGEADIKHSDLGWKSAAEYAVKLRMEEAVVEACRTNLIVWEHYLNGIADAADRKALE